MRIIALMIGLSLPLSILAVDPSSKDEDFEKLAKDYIEGYLSSHPEAATQLGDHRFDDQLTDYSASSQFRLLTRERQMLKALEAFSDPTKLSGANQVDVRILRENVEGRIFELEELKEPEWNPLVYNESLANSLYLILARDFDTPQKRIPNLQKRLEAIPFVIDQAKENLQHPPRVYTETAIEQIGGAINLVRHGLDPLHRCCA